MTIYPFSAIFRDFDHFEIYRLRGWANQRGLEGSAPVKMEKIHVFTRPKCGLQGVPENSKKWSLSKPLSNARGWRHFGKTRGQKKSRKIALFVNTVKTPNLALFRTFWPRDISVISDRETVGNFWKVTKMHRIIAVLSRKVSIFCSKQPRFPYGF